MQEKTSQNILKKIKFVMLLGKALHRYGASSDKIEKALTLVCERLDLNANFFSVPTSINASFKLEDDTEETRMDRLSPGKINLSKLCLVDQTVDQVIDHHLSIAEGTDLIEHILQQKPLYNNFVITLSYGLISSGISIFLKGSWFDSLVTLFLGLLVGFFAETVKEERLDSITEGITAFLVTFIAQYLVQFLPMINVSIIVLSALITLVPGLMLTTSISELASQNLTSGTARLTGSVMILLKISFGVYIANQLGLYFGFHGVQYLETEHSLLIILLSLVIVSFGLVFTFQAHKNDIVWIMIASALSYFSSKYLTLATSDAAGPFLAGTLIASASNIFSRLRNRPAMIFLLPAIILIVPGSIGFKGINLLFNKDLMAGMDSILHMTIIGVALVSGTYFGSILVKPRRTL